MTTPDRGTGSGHPPPPPSPSETTTRDGTSRTTGTGDEPEGFLATATGVLTAPTATFRAIARRRPVGQAIVVVLIAMALSYVVQGLLAATDPDGAAGEGVATGVAGVVLGVPLGLVFLLVWTAAVLLLSRAFGGDGDFRGTLTVLGFAYAPLVPGSLLAALAVPFQVEAFAFVVIAAATLWSLVLDVVGVREVHAISTGRAVGAVLSAAVILGVLAALLVFTLFAALFVTS